MTDNGLLVKGMAKYEDIFEALKADIVGGKYGSARQLPSERALMRTFGVSRNAVRHAIDELAKEKLVSRHHGRRSAVTYGGRGQRIGLIPCVADSEFFQPLALKMSQLCMDHGYSLLFAATGPRNVVELDVDGYAEKVFATAREFVAQKVAGILFQPVSFLPNADFVNEKVLAIFRTAKIPVVLLDYDAVPPPRRSCFDVVGIDNIAASLRICEHLVAVGARRIHFFRRPNCSNVVLNRMRGVALGVTLAGLEWGPQSVLECDLGDTKAIARHLRGRNRPDAIVCGFDAMALRVKSVADSIGLKVPDRLMIAGFDDSDDARFMHPPLTTIHQPCGEIAEAAFDRLLARIERPYLPSAEILLDAPLVVRGSTFSEHKGVDS